MSKVHLVTGPLVIARDTEGHDLYLYQGAVIPATVDAAERKRLVETGLVSEGDPYDALPDPLAVDDGSTAGDSDDDSKPAGNAAKAEWVDYAVDQGMPREDAEALGRDDLRDKYAG